MKKIKIIPVAVMSLIILSGCEAPIIGLLKESQQSKENIQATEITSDQEKKRIEYEKKLKDPSYIKELEKKNEQEQRKAEKEALALSLKPPDPENLPPVDSLIIDKPKPKPKKDNITTAKDKEPPDIEKPIQSKKDPAPNDQEHQEKKDETEKYKKIIEQQRKQIDELLKMNKKKEQKPPQVKPKTKKKSEKYEHPDEQLEATLRINYEIPDQAILLDESERIILYRSNRARDVTYYVIEKEEELTDEEIELLGGWILEIEEKLQKQLKQKEAPEE
ncbi:hypothetical protein [Thermoflavimicrobium daqui]|jgi:hypothetical protein|uniref:Lipoprotein n=1 Tax=Thermoflavimicrobium daqui TaxID=2137476 RepID=A0A364K1N3_9BACL|nr:hypothetical protein [Thermoflavimicrobium daqui]RAL21934.1 hypothetical protein DL897_15195 [Thermoflavimicrobium daqui]